MNPLSTGKVSAVTLDSVLLESGLPAVRAARHEHLKSVLQCMEETEDLI